MNREEYIKNRVEEHYKELQNLGFNIFAIILQGSQNYELDEYSDQYKSDIDTKAIILPDIETLIKGKQPYSHTHVMSNGEHIDIKDIRCMVEMWKKQNISYLELLYTKYYIVNPRYILDFNQLISFRDKISKINNIAYLNALTGSMHNKYLSLTKITPHSEEKIKKYGYDPKELHHLIRYFQLEKDYIEGKFLSDSLIPSNKDYLMEVKKGEVYNKEEAIKLADQIDKESKKLKDEYFKNHSVNIDKDTLNWLDEWYYDIIYDFVK